MFAKKSLWRRWAPASVLACAASLIAAEAFAHARWLPDGTTPGRNNQADIKSGPCGVSRTNTPAVLKAGETITLQWESTIYHQGYFRIAFSPADDAGFDQNILLDNIQELPNRYTGEYSAQVTLPSEPCDDCTLQMIQVMLDRNPPTNYYSCADIQLVADAALDTIAPQSVSGVEEERALPNLRLRWSNPSEDFAGVLVLHGETASQPQVGMAYQQGDAIGGARIVYTGAAQAVDLATVSGGDWLSVYAFDMAYNYSAPIRHQVLPAAGVAPPVVNLQYEQLMQPDSVIYAADGSVLVQANVSASAVNGDITTQWSVEPAMALPLDVLGLYQATLDPSDYAGQSATITVTVTDSASPSNVVTESFLISVAAYSYYQPRMVLMQQGKEVSQVSTDLGLAEIRVVFDGATPDDLSSWSTHWQHTIPDATEGALALSFTPTTSANYSVSGQVFSATAPASTEQTIAVSVSKPVKVGVFGGVVGLLLSLMLLARLGLRRRARLQGAV